MKKTVLKPSIVALFIAAIILSGLVSFAEGGSLVPGWIKNNAKWWSEGLISESDFVQGIQYLIKEEIIKVPSTQVSGERTSVVPAWVKNNAGWWAEGKISETDFLNGIQYLIRSGIIIVEQELMPLPTPSPTLTFYTDRSSYVPGDVVNVSGSISGVVGSVNIPLEIVDPNGIIILYHTFSTDNEGRFSVNYPPQDLTMMISGTYTVRAAYGAASNQMTYSFSIAEPAPEPSPTPESELELTVEINPVPWTLVNLVVDFNQNTAEYRAYQVSGDPFRIVCMEPCTIDEQLIFAKYQGFKNVHDDLIQFMGVDVLPEFAPVDIHLNDDHLCSYVPGVSTGSAHVDSSSGRGKVCVWDVEKENRFWEFTPENAIKVRDQGLLGHEYAHVILFGRNQHSWEDIVKVASFYISGLGGELIRDPCDEKLNVLAGGRMIYDMCQQHGLTFNDLTQSIIEMDKLYHQQNYLLSTYQYRKILDDILTADTSPIFYELFSGRPWHIGNSFVITPNGGEISVFDDWVTMIVPPGAVSENVVVTFDNDPKVGDSYRFQPYGLKFNMPVELIIKYNDLGWPTPQQESNMKLRVYHGSVLDTEVDVQAKILKTEISELDLFSFYFPT